MNKANPNDINPDANIGSQQAAPQPTMQAIEPPQAAQPAQVQAIPAIRGVFHYMGFGQNGEMYKIDEKSGQWRLANEADMKMIMEIIGPTMQNMMSSSIPNLNTLLPQIQNLMKSRY